MSNYIMDLRQFVGHRPLLQCAGSIIIENEKGQILLGRRTDNHLWGYAGGSVELTETVEECAKRELFEEMGLEVDSMEFFMVNSGPEAHYIYPNGDEVYNVEIIYLSKDYRGTPKRQEEEIEELRFFEPSELTMDMISPPIRPVFKKYLEQKGLS
ncbi:MAG: NUDIX domain-containing protein [Lachnospiraceae bacterium]|nr:NUDIX domain-containing protein [Lachnospiraceae bacterium]MBR4604898.1 NUDIX domain-containing protein [Lachnospiraceae bacterium]